ncbi:hypothetical protein V8B97DRAFT_1920489 [Scleroderma yunnanense]
MTMVAAFPTAPSIMFVNFKSLVVFVEAASVLAVQVQSSTQTSGAAASTKTSSAVACSTNTSSAAASSSTLNTCFFQCITIAAQNMSCCNLLPLHVQLIPEHGWSMHADHLLSSGCPKQWQSAVLLFAGQHMWYKSFIGTSKLATTTTPASAASSSSSAVIIPTLPAHTITMLSTSTSMSTNSFSSNATIGLVPFAFEGFFDTLVTYAGALIGAPLIL